MTGRKMAMDGYQTKVQPLMEGYLRKGGLNPPTTQTFVRPPPPAPMRAAQPQPSPPTKKP